MGAMATTESEGIAGLVLGMAVLVLPQFTIHDHMDDNHESKTNWWQDGLAISFICIVQLVRNSGK
jgi:hypothetical protein